MSGSKPWTSEEVEEAERSDRRVMAEAGDPLVLKPSAWERFRAPEPELNSYVAAMHALGDVRGKTVLEIGCGDGWLSVILAKLGARVTGFDISPAAIERANRRAAANDVAGQCRFDVASAYELPYPDASFDLAIGESVLHHLQHKERAVAELRRVLGPGSIAVFSEPFGNLLWLEWLRRFVPVRSASPENPDEWRHQLKYADLAAFRGTFHVQVREFQLLSRLDRVIGHEGFMTVVNRVDAGLLRWFPFLRPMARAALVHLQSRS